MASPGYGMLRSFRPQNGGQPIDPQSLDPWSAYTGDSPGGIVSQPQSSRVPGYSTNPIPYNSSTDTRDVWANERARATGRADARNAEFGDRQQRAGEGYEGDRTRVGDLYSSIWNGGGGYTADERARIVREGELNPLRWDPSQTQDAQLTNDERTQWEGTPYQPFDFYGGQVGNLENQLTSTNARLEGTAAEGAAGVNSAVQRMEASIDPVRLRSDPAYAARVRETLSGAGGALSRSINDPGLSVTDEYRRQAGMTDREVADAAKLAAGDAGSAGRTEVNRLERDVAASGTTNPLAVAAARASLGRSVRPEIARATTMARLAARGQQRNAAQGVQDTELRAAGTRADLTRSAVLPLAQMGIAAEGDIEGRRMAGEQDVSNRYLRTGEVGVRAAEGNRDANTNVVATTTGRQMDLGRETANNLTSLLASGEANAAERGRAAATNRQDTTRYGQDQQFQRGFNISQALSGAEANVAGARRADQAEGRAAAGALMNNSGARELDWAGLRLQNDQIGQQGSQNAAQALAQENARRSQNSFWNRFTGSLASGLGQGISSWATGGLSNVGQLRLPGRSGGSSAGGIYT